jgi:hypothetical protein
MKIRANNRDGGVLLITLLGSILLGTALAGYLKLSGAQATSVMRSQVWNSAIPISEAGIEEALAHINDSQIGTNYATDGWVNSGNQFTLSRAFGEGRYSVAISTDTYPRITAIGYVKDATRGGIEVKRTVLVTTTKWATGMKGLITKQDLTMTSNTEVDSFDSEDARYSTRGHYDPAKRKDGGFAGSVLGNVYGATIDGVVGTGPNGVATGTVGDFAWTGSNNGIEPGHYINDMNLAFPPVQVPFVGGSIPPSGGTVTLTNLDYWSTMITTTNYPFPPPASAVTTNFFGTITVTTPPLGIASSLITTNTTPQRTKTLPPAGTYINLVVQGAWNYYDLITSYSYPSLTYTYSMTATNSSVTTENYDYVLQSDRYDTPNLSLSGGQRLLVVGTNVSLYIPGDFSMTGNSKLIIAPGASLKVYVGGATSLAGNGIFNYTLDASHFMYYGLPSNTSISISGNAAFTGCIYAPNANLSLNGGGNTIYDVVGASVTKTANMNGHFRFHYDERLGRSPIQSKYSVALWREV